MTINNAGTIRGGNGGTGLAGFYGGGGSGGRGGDGIGAGGYGGNGSRIGGGAGGGLDGPVAIVNTGTIQGGNGGTGVNGPGAGGVGISGGNMTIVNAGTIAGGLANGGAGAQADAINFTGGTNSLELQGGYHIIGRVGNANSTTVATNALILGGTVNATFDTSLIAPVGNTTLQYQNFSQFRKTGLSTWTLVNTTTAATPWVIDQGTLSIAQDGSLGAASGALTLNGGTLETTTGIVTNRNIVITASNGTIQTDTQTYAVSGAISGPGGLTKTGPGTLLLSGANTYAGSTNVNAGTLQAGAVNTFSPNSAVTVASAATVDLDGFNQTVLGVTNAGLVRLGATGGAPGTVLTTINYVGQGGTLTLNTLLGGDASPSDKLAINGGQATGTTNLLVSNVGGLGAQTTGNGIMVVEALNGATSANSFQLARPLQAGAYQYLLYEGGKYVPTSDWYLRSELISPPSQTATVAIAAPAYRPAVPGYTLTPQFNLDYGFSELGRLHERVGDIAALEKYGALQGNDGVWGRIGGSDLNADSGRFSGDGRTFFAQFGKDWTVSRSSDGGSTHVGATVTLGQNSANFSDRERSIVPGLATQTGSVSTDAQSVGGYWTRYLADGAYFDGVGQLTHYRNRYGDSTGLSASQDGLGAAASAEVGKPFLTMFRNVILEPQVQLMYQYLHLGHFDDAVSGVSSTTENALRGRVGVRLSRLNLENESGKGAATPYFTADILHDFAAPGQTVVGGTAFSNGLSRTWYELGAGVTAGLGKSNELYLNIKYAHNIGGDYRQGVFGQVGYRYAW